MYLAVVGQVLRLGFDGQVLGFGVNLWPVLERISVTSVRTQNTHTITTTTIQLEFREHLSSHHTSMQRCLTSAARSSAVDWIDNDEKSRLR